MSKRFIPFYDIRKYDRVLVVDSYHPAAFTLSHWRGAPIHPGIHDDTSTGIVLNALKAGIPQLDYPHITNNHFDIDGFLGVWALFNPSLALQYEEVLRQMARLGDFRELYPAAPQADISLKLVCWINTVEKRKFYGPFEAPEHQDKEAILCVPKYTYFLQHFRDVLLNTEHYISDYHQEYQRVIADMQMIRSQSSNCSDYPELGLRIVQTPQPIHYYALFHESIPYSIIVSIYDEGRYELEYKYITWVDTGRNTYPRLKLSPLAQRLSCLEPHGKTWRADSIFDTGPILRVNAGKLSKAQRFDHPYRRVIAPSDIPKDVFIKEVTGYFSRYLSGLPKKDLWTWKEMREINDSLSLS
ncbi:DUF6687 family protein [Roseivirga sp. BDSF3-8]|uniref:DUF6687 family protein n=1 Tax=Roseivirga sp. BDSF3-8 TaxID=3241598 RepID=UPI003531FAA5